MQSNREPHLHIIESEPIIGGRFKNIKRLNKNGGDGVFSLVFTAYDKTLKKKIILKFFDPDKAYDTDRVERFQREAKLLQLMQDEKYVIDCIGGGVQNFVKQVFDSNGNPIYNIPFQYFAMEKADNNAEHFIYKLHPDPIKILTVFREMCKAVFRIHKKKMPHRDLKPNNFLFVSDRLCLGDMGTAKFLDGSMPDIRDNYYTPVGDTRYISPEIIFSIGIADDYVYKSDVFSLGAILFEMFTNTVFTNEIYKDAEFLKNCHVMAKLLDKAHKNYRLQIYLDYVDAFSNAVKIPDIFSYYDNVPNSIKYRINDLYKALVDIDCTKRLSNFHSIFRKLDICIKILSNQKNYDRWLEEKRIRREIRSEKEKHINRKYHDN